MRTIKIFGKPYKYTKKRMPDKNGRIHWGKTEFHKGEITVSTDAPKLEQFDTTIHEALHVIDAELGLGLNERTVRGLAVGVCDLIVNNPGLFRPHILQKSNRVRKERKKG